MPRLARGLDALEAALRAEHVSESAVLDLRLVAEEVLTNVAKYGHDDDRKPRIRLRLAVRAHAVRLEFADDCRPFDPLSAPTPDLEPKGGERAVGGLGLHLIRALVDSAEYERVGGRNVLTLTKRLGGARDVP